MKEKEGIILNSIDYKEKSKILYLLTEEGKKSLLVNKAKNYKDGLTNICSNLTKVSFIDNEKNLPRATYINAIDYYSKIKNDIKKMSVLEYVLELLYKVDFDYNQKMLYDMTNKFIDLVTERDDLFFLLLEYRIKMLYFLGIKPSFDFCSYCGSRKNLVGLSIARGGMECINHTSHDNIGITSTKLIHLLYSDKEFKLTYSDLEVLKHLSEIIDNYYKKYFNYELKSISLLKTFELY